jgi:hypothetical protein
MIEPYFKDETVTIFNADARAVLPHLEMVDVILTDPPYGIGFASQPTKWQRRAGRVPEFWDEATVPDIVLALPEKARRVVIWGGNYYPLPCTRGWLSWFKPDAPPSMAHFELAWTNQDQNARQISHSISATNSERLGHATQKPLAVMKWSLKTVGVREALQSGGGGITRPVHGSWHKSQSSEGVRAQSNRDRVIRAGLREGCSAHVAGGLSL